MIQNEDILSLNFYEKEKFTGSYRGMRYRIEKDTGDTPPMLRVYNWPGPYNFNSTDDTKKTTAVFPFTSEGKQQAVDWLNGQWESRKEEWPIP